MTFDADLIAAVGAEHVHAIDATSWRVQPGSAAEVAEVIRRARTAKAAVYAVGAGGRTRAAASGDRPAVYIATKRLDQVLELDEASLLVHAQAGITGLELERILAPRNLSVGDYPPVVLTSSLGGIIAVRTPGKSSARHGFFEDAVAGVSAVLADGRTVHTRVAPRRATGPDLSRVLCGSEGTIGFITSVVLRIHPRPEARLVAAFILPSIEHAVSAVYLALREEAAPSGIRIYDARQAAIHYPGHPPIPDGSVLLLAATAGPTDLAACDRDLIASAVIAEGGAATDTALAEIWWRRTHGGDPTPGPAPAFQVMATPSKLRAVYRGVTEALAPSGGASVHISRFDADGAVMFVTFPRDDDGERLKIAERAAELAGGWLLGARAVKLDVYLAALRDAIDPDRIMNPNTL